MAFHNVRDKNGKFARKDGGVSTPKLPKVAPPVVAKAPTPAPLPLPVKIGRTYVAFVLDNSGSMNGLRTTVVNGYNRMLAATKASFAGQDVWALMQTFSDSTRIVTQVSELSGLPEISDRDYWNSSAGGYTALFRSVDDAITSLLNQPANKDTAYLVITFTDGDENASGTRGAIEAIMSRCTELEGRGTWTFTYQVPPRSADSFARNWSVPRGNIREWEATTRGFNEAVQHTNSAVQAYASARSLGHTQVASFYVTTDLSKVTQADLSKLTNLAPYFKSHTVDKEVDVKDFIEKKTKHQYVIGQAYYQLMKMEKVQPQKKVLIKEKTSGAIYGGPEARSLIGLPSGADANVTPGNHANYDIFVQSTSVNRKLPRGTQVLVDTSHVVGSTPTWGTP